MLRSKWTAKLFPSNTRIATCVAQEQFCCSCSIQQRVLHKCVIHAGDSEIKRENTREGFMMLNMGPLLLVYQWWMGTSATVAFRRLAGLITTKLSKFSIARHVVHQVQDLLLAHWLIPVRTRIFLEWSCERGQLRWSSPNLICSEVQLGSSHL